MSDYIKREDVWELSAILHSEYLTDEQEQLLERLDTAIDDISSADVVEVVRCKDCKHYYNNKRYGWMCEILSHAEQGDDFYCSYGERKDNE